MFVPNGSGGPRSTGDALYLASLDRAWHRQSRPMRVTIAPAAKPNRVMTPPRFSDRGASLPSRGAPGEILTILVIPSTDGY